MKPLRTLTTLLAQWCALVLAAPVAAQPLSIESIDQDLALLASGRVTLRENTRALIGPAAGTASTVAAYRSGPEIRRIVVETPTAAGLEHTEFHWIRGRLVHAQRQLQAAGADASTKPLSSDQWHLSGSRVLRWAQNGVPTAATTPAAAQRAAEVQVQGHSMLRLLTTPLPRGVARCDWSCSSTGPGVCPRYRCN